MEPVCIRPGRASTPSTCADSSWHNGIQALARRGRREAFARPSSSGTLELLGAVALPRGSMARKRPDRSLGPSTLLALANPSIGDLGLFEPQHTKVRQPLRGGRHGRASTIELDAKRSNLRSLGHAPGDFDRTKPAWQRPSPWCARGSLSARKAGRDRRMPPADGESIGAARTGRGRQRSRVNDGELEDDPCTMISSPHVDERPSPPESVPDARRPRLADAQRGRRRRSRTSCH